jgi:hypothetical protein
MKVPNPPWKAARKAVLKAYFEKLPFTPSRYIIDIWIGDGSADLDTVSGAATVDIVPDDVYGSGVIPFTSHGAVMLYPTWNIDAIC